MGSNVAVAVGVSVGVGVIADGTLVMNRFSTLAVVCWIPGLREPGRARP